MEKRVGPMWVEECQLDGRCLRLCFRLRSFPVIRLQGPLER